MTEDARSKYDNVVTEITSTSPSTAGKMFGMPCLKNDVGKAFAGFYEGSMVFKLAGSAHSEALGLSSSYLFDPSGLGRPMKEWVVVPSEHSDRWLDLAREGLRYSHQGQEPGKA